MKNKRVEESFQKKCFPAAATANIFRRALIPTFQKFFLKNAATVTLVCFFLTEIFSGISPEAFAADMGRPFLLSVPVPFSGIPRDMGKLDGIFTPAIGNQTVFVLHLKDAHASMEGQKNIARILMRLRKKKQLDLILLEGAAGTLTPGRLNVFQDPKKNGAFKKDLFDAGLLNGAAYFAASHEDAASHGLEDPAVYLENLEIFRRIVAMRPGTAKFFSTVEALMMNTFKKILRADVFIFLKEWKMQHQRELSWDRYLPFLVRSAEQFLGLDLRDYHAQTSWPNLVRFSHLDLIQDEIRSHSVRAEFRMLAKALERDRDLTVQQVLTLLAATIESSAAMVRETPGFRKYVEILVEACRRRGILLQRYPHLVRYLSFRIFRSEVEPEGLLAEVERLEDAIFDKLFLKGKMRGIISVYRDFFLLKRAFGLDLDRSESKRFLGLDIEQKLHQFSKISQGYDLQEKNVIRGASLVKQFYTAAQKRDGIFMEQVKDSINKAQVFPDRPFFIALVTGGYHAEGIENWFLAEGIPFASIQPLFRDEPQMDRYENLLIGNYRTTDTLAPAQGSIEPDAMAEKLMGRGAFLALRSAEANLMPKHGAVPPQNTRSSKVSRSENRSFSKEGVRRTLNLAGQAEVRPPERKGISQRRFTLMLMFATAGLLSGCGTLRHDELKAAIRSAEEFALPRSSLVVPAAILVDSQSLLLHVIENDPKVKKAEIEIAIREIEKDRLKGSWSIISDVAWVDGKPVFSVGVKGMIPHVIEGGVTGLGVGNVASLALDLASSLGSVLRGEPLLATALAEKIVEIAKLNHQRVIGERYAHYAAIALEVRQLQQQIETAENAGQALDTTLRVAQERKETSGLEIMKIREMQTRWRVRADEHRSFLKAKGAELLNLYVPGTSGRTEFSVGFDDAKLPAGWEAGPAIIAQLRTDVTKKNGTQLPPNRELAAAYKGREAAVITRELEHARNRFRLSVGGLGHIDNKNNSDFNPGKINEAVNRRYQAKNSAGAGLGLTGGPAADVDERVAAGEVEITQSILLDVQRTVEDEIARLAYRIEENQRKIETQTAELLRLKQDIKRAREAKVAGRRLVTEDKLAEFISKAWEYQSEIIAAHAEINKSVLQLEVSAGVLGELSWRNVGDGRSELREVSGMWLQSVYRRSFEIEVTTMKEVSEKLALLRGVSPNVAQSTASLSSERPLGLSDIETVRNTAMEFLGKDAEGKAADIAGVFESGKIILNIKWKINRPVPASGQAVTELIELLKAIGIDAADSRKIFDLKVLPGAPAVDALVDLVNRPEEFARRLPDNEKRNIVLKGLLREPAYASRIVPLALGIREEWIQFIPEPSTKTVAALTEYANTQKPMVAVWIRERQEEPDEGKKKASFWKTLGYAVGEQMPLVPTGFVLERFADFFRQWRAKYDPEVAQGWQTTLEILSEIVPQRLDIQTLGISEDAEIALEAAFGKLDTVAGLDDILDNSEKFLEKTNPILRQNILRPLLLRVPNLVPLRCLGLSVQTVERLQRIKISGLAEHGIRDTRQLIALWNTADATIVRPLKEEAPGQFVSPALQEALFYRNLKDPSDRLEVGLALLEFGPHEKLSWKNAAFLTDTQKASFEALGYRTLEDILARSEMRSDGLTPLQRTEREQFFAILELLNSLWWLRQEPPFYHDKQHLDFEGDAPRLENVLRWTDVDFAARRQSIRDIIRHRISEGRLEYVHFSQLARLSDFQALFYPEHFPEIDAAILTQTSRIAHQMRNYLTLIRGWEESIFSEKFAGKDESAVRRSLGGFFKSWPGILDRIESVQRSLKGKKESAKAITGKLLEVEAMIRGSFSRETVDLSLLNLEKENDPSIEKALAVIRRNASYLRTYSAIQMGMEQDTVKEVAIAELVDTALAVGKNKKQEPVHIERDFHEGVRAKVQEIKLSEVLLNLLRNAVQALGDRTDGSIKVSIRQKDGRFTIAIRDNGEGIRPENLEKIRNLISFTTKAGGHGIGLPLTLRQIAEMGGTWEVDSRQQTEGQKGWTEFRIALPVDGSRRSELRDQRSKTRSSRDQLVFPGFEIQKRAEADSSKKDGLIFEQELDRIWSHFVKLRAGFRSELSGEAREPLHAHHVFGKATDALRWDPDNGVCLTQGEHHSQAHGPQTERAKFWVWATERMTSEAKDRLLGAMYDALPKDRQGILHRLERQIRELKKEQPVKTLPYESGDLVGQAARSEMRALRPFHGGYFRPSWWNLGGGRSELRTAQKKAGPRTAPFSKLKLFIGIIAIFFSLTTGVFAAHGGANPNGFIPRNDVVEKLKPGNPGTELGHAYEMYDGFTSRILDTIREGSGKSELKRFAQILRVTIVSEETLRRAQQLFVHEVMTKEAAVMIKTAAVSGPAAIGAGFVGAVETVSGHDAQMKKTAETKHDGESVSPLKELDGQLGRAVPGFKKLLKNPQADPATVEGYRNATLNAILTARPVDPKNTVDPKSFQKVFFNWDNPFHSAWNHRDAMERSVAKGRVVVNPAFRDKINSLASQAGMLGKVTESEPAPQGTQEAQVKIEGAISGPAGVAAGAASVVGNTVHANVPSEPVVERPNPVTTQPQASSLVPGPTGADQLPASVPQDQADGLSPVMQILLAGASGAAEIPHRDEVSDSALAKSTASVDPSLPEIEEEQQPASVSAVSAPLATSVVPGEQTTSPVTHQPVVGTTVGVSPVTGGGVTDLGSAINNATNVFPMAGTISAAASQVVESSSDPEAFPEVVPGQQTGSTGGNVFSGKAVVNPVLLNLPAALSGIPKYAVKEGGAIPSGGIILKIIDPENASRIRALAAEIALMDAQLADGSLNVEEYTNLQFEKESLERELRERNYQEEIRTLKASHPLKIVKLTRGQVNQGDVAVYGVQLDAGQISFRLPLGFADFDDAELQVNGETVRALRYDLSDFDPVSGQFLLTIDFVSPSGKGHDPQIAYSLKLDRRHEQGVNDPALGKSKPFRVIVPHREPVPVTVPVAPGVPGGVFHALVPEGTIVSAGTPIGFIDASGYQQEQLDAAKGLGKLVGEISAANQNFAAVSPEELRRLNAEAGLRIASLEGVNPKIVIRAPVAGRVVGLIPVEGQTVIPGKATGVRVLNSLVFLGSTDSSDSGHLIDVPKGSVRERERVRVRTPLGNVLDGTIFKVQPLADENGLWLSDRDAIVVQVEDSAGQLGDDMPVEIWNGVPVSEKEKTPAPAAGLAALPVHYGSDLPPAVLYQLLRHPDQELSGSVRSVLAGEGSFRQILSSWKFFFGSPKGLASFGAMIRTGLLLVIGSIVSLWAGTKIVQSLKQKLKWLNPQGRLNDLALETRELQIRLEQKNQTQDKELLEDVITSVNEWIRILSDEEDLDHESLSTILIKAQELAGNKHLAFSRMKFQNLGMWKDGIGDDLAAIYGILTVLSILTVRRIALQSKKGSLKAAMELHELHRFQQGIVDYGDIFNESYALAHHLIGMSQTMDLFPPKVVRGLKPLSFFDGLRISHNRLVRFLYPVARMWLWVSPVVFLHKMDTLRSYRSLGRKMEGLGLKTPEDTKRDNMNAKQGLTYALNSQVTLNQPAGSKMAMHYGRFWRRFITILAISSLFLPTIVLTFLGLHWLTATALMSIGKIILPFAAIGFHIIPIVINFSGKHHNVWNHELVRLRRQNARRERSLPELPKPQAVPKNAMEAAMPRQGSEQIAMSKVLNALYEGAQNSDLEVVALVPPQYGENKTVLEQLIQRDAVLSQWAVTVAESDGEFPGDAGLFYAARNIAKTSQKKFKIYWYPQVGIDFQTALSVFKINLGEAARMIGDLRAAGVRFGEVAFPGGNLISSSVGITKNGGHFVVQARHASLNEIEDGRLPAILGRNGTSRLEIEHVFYDSEQLRQMMAAGPLHLGSGRVDLGNAALPQIPVPTGPIAIVAETSEDHQMIQELLDKTDEKVRNLIGRFGPFRINFLEDIVRPVAELSGQVAKSSATPPNPNLLVNKTVRLSDDSIVSPYDKLYTAVSRFLWNGGNGNRRSLKAEAFIPPVSETVYVSGEDRQKLAQSLGRIAVNFPELVDRELSQKLREEGLTEAKAKLVFRDDAGRTVLEKKKPGYRRGLRSVDVAGFVTKDEKQVLQRRNYQIGNEPGRLDVAFAGHQDETDNNAEAAAQREFHEELLGGRNPIPLGLTFHAMGSEVQLDITHEGEKGLSVRKKSTAVFRVSLNGKPSWNDFLPGDNAVEIVGLTREELETALRETPGRFTARAFQLFTKLGPEIAFSEPGTGLAGRPEQHSKVSQPPASRSELRNEMPPAVIPLPVAEKGGLSGLSVRFKEEDVEIPSFQVTDEMRILAAIVVAEKILAANDAGLMPMLEASLEDRGKVSERIAPALAALAGAHDVPVEALKARLELLLHQEQMQPFADDRIVFLDAGTVPAEFFQKLINSPVPVVVLFDRRHQALYDQVSKEQLRRNQKSGVLLVYAPDGVSTFVRRALQSGDALLTVSPRLNALLTRFRNHGKADDIALITSGRAESQKVEADYVGHRYYYGDETLRLDPELIFYSLQLLLRSPELFRYGKGRNAQDAVSLIGLVLQQLAQEFQAKRGITSSV